MWSCNIFSTSTLNRPGTTTFEPYSVFLNNFPSQMEKLCRHLHAFMAACSSPCGDILISFLQTSTKKGSMSVGSSQPLIQNLRYPALHLGRLLVLRIKTIILQWNLDSLTFTTFQIHILQNISIQLARSLWKSLFLTVYFRTWWSVINLNGGSDRS